MTANRHVPKFRQFSFTLLCLLANKVISSILHTFHTIGQISVSNKRKLIILVLLLSLGFTVAASIPECCDLNPGAAVLS